MTQSEIKSINGRGICDNRARDQLLNKAEKKSVDSIQVQLNNLVVSGTGNSNPEVVQARGNYSILNERLDAIDDLFNMDINLFNVDNSEIVTGKYINENGNISTLSGVGISHYVRVFPKSTYACKFYKNMFGTNTIVEFSNSSKVKLSTLKATNTDSQISFTVPDNSQIMYCRVNLLLSDINNFIFKPGSDITTKIFTLSENFGLNNNQKNIVKDISPNVLENKIVSFNGDSICYGAGYRGGYGKIIADKNNMIYENIAVSGATITGNTTYSTDGSNRHWICRTINSMRSDADYIIIEGGANDKSLRTVNLGTITDGYSDVLDDTTFCGALESTCKQLIQRFPGKKLGFIITHRIWGINDVWETSWYPSMIKILKKWGIPYCDLQNEIPSLNLIDSLKSAYTDKSDGWHPNELGYKKYYCDKIESWMKTL